MNKHQFSRDSETNTKQHIRQLSDFQIRGDNKYNLGINVIFLHKKTCCDSSLEPSRRDGSNEGDNIVFC